MTSLIFVFALWALFLTWGTSAKCPPLPSIAPCTCYQIYNIKGDEFSVITCRGLQSKHILENVINNSRPYDVVELEITFSILDHLPSNAFNGTHFQVISIHNSTLKELSDSPLAFKGLENSLVHLEILNCSFAEGWDWMRLSHLRKLTEVHIADSEHFNIAQGIFNIARLSINSLAFPRNTIEILDNEAFASFPFLHSLSLDGNKIMKVQRSMFPRPAQKLVILGLSYNYIHALPEDIFSEMPALKTLYLSGNQLFTIDETVFKPVWNQLHLLLYESNPLVCDCKLIWLYQMENRNKYVNAPCHLPLHLTGRELLTLFTRQLVC